MSDDKYKNKPEGRSADGFYKSPARPSYGKKNKRPVMRQNNRQRSYTVRRTRAKSASQLKTHSEHGSVRSNGRRPKSSSTFQKPNQHIHRRGVSINRSTTFVSVLFFLFISVYLARTLFAFFTTPEIAIEMVLMGNADVPRDYEGIIIRDEVVYTAPRNGTVQYHVSEYERVKTDTAVASILNVQEVENLQQSLYDVEEQIMDLQSMRATLSAVDPAVQYVNAQIKNITDTHLSGMTNPDMSTLYAFKESLSQRVNTRNQMIISDNQNVRTELGIAQQQYIAQLNANRNTLYAQNSGIISPVVDGLESELTFQNMSQLSREQTRRQVDYNKLNSAKEVSEGDAVFKIVKSNEWYIAVYLPNEEIEGFNLNEVRTVYVKMNSSFVPLSMRVHSIEPGLKESFVIFKSTKYIIDFLNMRSINIKTTDSVQTGLKIVNTAIVERSYHMIPMDCVYDDAGFTYVNKLFGAEDIQIPITISEQNGEFAYVPNDNTLAEGDTLRNRNEPSAWYRLAQPFLIQGVYKVNNGIAVFQKITLPDDALPDNSGFTVLNPSLNPGLQMYDHIVSDASLVTEGQIVFNRGN